MNTVVMMDMEEYRSLAEAKDELQRWNRFMDQLDQDPEAFAKVLSEEKGKPGNALFTLYKKYQQDENTRR